MEVEVSRYLRKTKTDRSRSAVEPSTKKVDALQVKIVSTLVPPGLSGYRPCFVPTWSPLTVWLFEPVRGVTALRSWFMGQCAFCILTPGREIGITGQNWKRMRRVTEGPHRRARLPDLTHWLWGHPKKSPGVPSGHAVQESGPKVPPQQDPMKYHPPHQVALSPPSQQIPPLLRPRELTASLICGSAPEVEILTRRG